MLFYIYYSCGCGNNEEIISASSRAEAEKYAYICAREDYESYEGLHGVRSFGEILEDEFGIIDGEDENAEDFYEEAEEIYNEEIENTISYGVKTYDEGEHGWLLKSQENEPYEI